VTTMFPLRLCGGKPLVAVTRERRYGPSRLRVNDDDDDDDDEVIGQSSAEIHLLPVSENKRVPRFKSESRNPAHASV